MTKIKKLILKVLEGKSDTNLSFADLRNLLIHLGFEERVRGSHHVFLRAGVEELINLQREGKMAKSYQVKQVRAVIARHGLGEDE